MTLDRGLLDRPTVRRRELTTGWSFIAVGVSVATVVRRSGTCGGSA
ncbi:hypothetical protein [Streptomyces collinus]|uniref:Uncharacterized protein n=1 Tax=Streptomyces collinus TaxID=42684 RepID=A0AA89Q9A0_STRCU|nr:hypothetical protein [Streptomyces collinus]MBB5816646.1 hypothetical protein [Streptomyces collinus]WMX62087.1 hypothetical protein RFN52_01410 [Streptomyces collinus]